MACFVEILTEQLLFEGINGMYVATKSNVRTAAVHLHLFIYLAPILMFMFLSVL